MHALKTNCICMHLVLCLDWYLVSFMRVMDRTGCLLLHLKSVLAALILLSWYLVLHSIPPTRTHTATTTKASKAKKEGKTQVFQNTRGKPEDCIKNKTKGNAISHHLLRNLEDYTGHEPLAWAVSRGLKRVCLQETAGSLTSNLCQILTREMLNIK